MKVLTPYGATAPVLALCLAVGLSACSDDGSVRVTSDDAGGSTTGASGGTGGGSDAGTGVTTGGDGAVAVTPPPDGPGIGGSTGGGTTGSDPVTDAPGETDLPAGSRAGAYIGTVAGAPAVFVLGLDEAFIGIWPDATTGSSVLVNGVQGAEQGLRSVQHDSGYAGARAPQYIWPFGGPLALDATTDLTVVDDESITGSINGLPVSLTASDGELALPTAARLDGEWSAAIPFCDSNDEHCTTITTDLSFSGNAFTGNTAVLGAGGDDLFPSTLEGTLTREGDSANVTMVWNTYRYEGVLHFLPGETDRLALIGFTTAPLADHPSIAFILSR